MKIPFDLNKWLKDKSQKVVTADGHSARIICTDAKGSMRTDDIIALIGGELGSENIYRYYSDGTLISKANRDKVSRCDLFLVTDEPELTELKKAVSDLCWRIGMGEAVKDDSQIKREADKLLSIARKQLKAEGWEYTDPLFKECVANNSKTSADEDERIRKEIISALKFANDDGVYDKHIAYLEKQKDASKAIEAVDRIDKYIDIHLANAHDMKDSNPDKKYYRGWDDALGEMAGILQDVYSDEKQKEPTEDLSTRLNGLMQEYVKSGKDEEEQEHRLKCYHLFWDALGDSEFFEQKEQKVDIDKLRRDLYQSGYNDGYQHGQEDAQKEQEDDEDEDFTIYHPLKNAKGEYECIPYSFYGSLTSFSEDKDLIDFFRTCFYTEEECNEWIEQQKEQKPAEWKPTEEQFNYLAKAIMTLGEKGDCKTAGVLNEIRNGLKYSFPDWKMSSDYPEEGCNVSLNGEIKKIQEPKQEWSEEDKKALDISCFIIGSIDTYHDPILRQKCLDFLCELPKRFALPKKQEWSEEDENKLNHILEIVHIASGSEASVNEKEELESFLKSLRPQPHWKPSEEQMYSLGTVVKGSGECSVGSVGYNLQTLYIDLIKLRED